jgi:hypothetical protein
MLVAAWSGTKWSYHVDAPYGEGPRLRDSAQSLSWQVLLFSKELASFAPLDKVFCISYGHGTIESRSVCFTDQVRGCGVAATLTTVYLGLEL